MDNEKEIAKSVLPEVAKGSMQLINQFYQDLAQPTVKTIGKTLNTAFEFATIPAMALGLATENVKANFAHRMEEYKKKLDEIPENDRCVVEPEIGVPIINNLVTTTNAQIADLFTTLLANASNINTLNKAHPKFAQIVQNLTPDEALIIAFLKGHKEVCYVNFRGEFGKGKGFYTIMSYVTLIPEKIKLAHPKNINAYISNLISLGILLDMSGICKIDDTVYKEIENLYKPALEKTYVPGTFTHLTLKKSYLKTTDFGDLFIDACIA